MTKPLLVPLDHAVTEHHSPLAADRVARAREDGWFTHFRASRQPQHA